ncbi:MAG: SRPBCC family protein [Sphingomonadaceae bacterium]|nr:SRPBCC family protein [Sphingomonadaceae bacterium]
MAWPAVFDGGIRRLTYAVAAPAAFLSQHAILLTASAALGQRLPLDAEFWLMPLASFAQIPDLSPGIAALAFVANLIAAALLAMLAFRRAAASRQGYALVPFVLVPIVQVVALFALAAVPVSAEDESTAPPEAQANAFAIVQGMLAGMALILFGVTVSALAFGAYGWGLFVFTPFVVGLTTAYLANRNGLIDGRRSQLLVLAAAALGCLMLIAVALEGLVCIILAAPLGAGAALVGGLMGRALAAVRAGGSAPLACVAVLPLLFAIEAAMPPNVVIRSNASIDIAAPPAAVWRALTSDEEIRLTPGLPFRLGLAYPIRARLLGQGVGAERLGFFSTGIARERITEWQPGRRLAFALLSQPPVMTELSPYAEVHAPHVRGYFETRATGFILLPLPGGRTRLVVEAEHVLRLDPVLYWEPVARWAIGRNLERVLADLRARAEQAGRS